MTYNIVYIPSQVIDRSKYSKGHGGHTGAPGEHHEAKYDPISGKFLLGTNGCAKFANCFECPFPQCRSELNKRTK